MGILLDQFLEATREFEAETGQSALIPAYIFLIGGKDWVGQGARPGHPLTLAPNQIGELMEAMIRGSSLTEAFIVLAVARVIEDQFRVDSERFVSKQTSRETLPERIREIAADPYQFAIFKEKAIVLASARSGRPLTEAEVAALFAEGRLEALAEAHEATALQTPEIIIARARADRNLEVWRKCLEPLVDTANLETLLMDGFDQ